MAHEVTHNEEARRYELRIDGVLAGIAEYSELDGMLVFPHTEIDAARRGQGLGAILVQAALDDVRPTGRKVIPACWYVAEFIDEHPAYADLLAS